jgi:hypothetical protein
VFAAIDVAIDRLCLPDRVLTVREVAKVYPVLDIGTPSASLFVDLVFTCGLCVLVDKVTIHDLSPFFVPVLVTR